MSQGPHTNVHVSQAVVFSKPRLIAMEREARDRGADGDGWGAHQTIRYYSECVACSLVRSPYACTSDVCASRPAAARCDLPPPSPSSVCQTCYKSVSRVFASQVTDAVRQVRQALTRHGLVSGIQANGFLVLSIFAEQHRLCNLLVAFKDLTSTGTAKPPCSPLSRRVC